MKKVFILIVCMLMVLPINAFAASKYTSLNLKEALKAEGIDEEFTSYSENKKQVKIYMFRGNGCGYCKLFLNFLNSITDEYGQYFKLVSYEVWSDSNNKELLNNVSNFLGQPAKGVPYIVIGDKVFAGYSSQYDEQIKSLIKEMYNKDVSDRYDVLDEMEKEEKNSGSISILPIVLFNLLFTFISTVTIIIVNKKQNEKTKKELINELKKTLKNAK